MSANGNLIRKQYLVSKSNLSKVEKIAKEKGTSATEVIRQAIDAYDPAGAANNEAPELMELVAARLKDAIASTRKANKVVTKALKSLAAGKG